MDSECAHIAHGGRPRLLETVRQEMRLRNYSYKTVKAYIGCLRMFIGYIHPKHPREATDENLRAFLLHLINALRFLYVDLYERPMALGAIPRPSKEKKLPVVMSEGEVRRLFGAVSNLKHRTLLMVVYSAGLRVSEVVRLHWEDLDEERGMMHIPGAKGKKDRYTILSGVVGEALRRYWREFHPREWLIEGEKPGTPYSIRSAESVFENAANMAGISIF